MVPIDSKLYAKVKSEADAKFLAPTSAYKSAWIVRTYKNRGGTFEDKPDPNKGLSRWFKEKWVDINREYKPCGRPKATLSGVYPLCRPSVKITDETPRLVSDITTKSKKVANEEKQKNKLKRIVGFHPHKTEKRITKHNVIIINIMDSYTLPETTTNSEVCIFDPKSSPIRGRQIGGHPLPYGELWNKHNENPWADKSYIDRVQELTAEVDPQVLHMVQNFH